MRKNIIKLSAKLLLRVVNVNMITGCIVGYTVGVHASAANVQKRFSLLSLQIRLD